MSTDGRRYLHELEIEVELDLDMIRASHPEQTIECLLPTGSSTRPTPSARKSCCAASSAPRRHWAPRYRNDRNPPRAHAPSDDHTQPRPALRHVPTAETPQIAERFLAALTKRNRLVELAYRELQQQTDRQFAALTDSAGPYRLKVVSTGTPRPTQMPMS